MENLIIGFLVGTIFGAGVVFIINWLRRKESKTVAQDLEGLLARIKESFSAISMDALTKQNQLGNKDLEGKKELIDQTLGAMNKSIQSDLQKVHTLITGLEKDRESKFGELTNQLKATAEQTAKLQETTNSLRSALASTKARGQWGERMAEDVLRFAGFIEGINYQKQKTMESLGTRPDFTFLLPKGLKVNMDVKFPLDNYLHYMEEEGKADKENYKNQFLKDVRNRIKEVTTRDYINPAENTLDYVIVFIPNEQVYAFINENDSEVMNEALRNKVILCSPITLYAILAVIRQALDNFNMEKTAAQMLSLFGSFRKQWDNFTKSFDKVGRKIEEAQDEFNNLTTTRRRQLEKPIKELEELRKEQGISEPQLTEADTPLLENMEEIDEEQ
jgi:DNA recombination protein RmuC